MATLTPQQSTQVAQALLQAIQKGFFGPVSSPTKTSAPSTSSGISVPSSPPKPATTTPTPSFSGGFSQPKPTTPSGSVSSAPKTSSPQLNVSTSIVDYLKSIGQPSDFTSRKLLAEKYGIKDYVGSAEQNVQLLNLLKGGGGSSQTVPATAAPSSSIVSPVSAISPSPAQQVQPSTTSTQQQPITDLDAQIEQKVTDALNKFLKPVDYAEVAKQAAQIAQTMNQPLVNAFDELKTTLINQFELAKQDLMEQHQQEKENLVGQWAERGFAPTDPIVQRALQQLGEIQEREINDLENKKASHLADLAYNTMKVEPSTVTQIMNSILTTERSGLTSVIDLLDKIAAAKERRRQKEQELVLKTAPQIKTEIQKLTDGVYLVTYRVNPVTGATEIINRIKIGAAPQPQRTFRVVTPMKDALGNVVGNVVTIYDAETGEQISQQVEQLPRTGATRTPSPSTEQPQTQQGGGLLRNIIEGAKSRIREGLQTLGF
jgi:hypothetical protein